MSLSYTTGNPSNLTAGATASMNDIAGPFADIKTFLTDASGAVNDTILASPTNSVWRTVFNISGTVVNATANKYWFAGGGATASGGGSASQAPSGLWIPPAATDEAVTGKTTRLRTRVTWITDNIAPGVTLTWGLYPVSGLAGIASGFDLTLGTVVPSSTAAVVTPGVTTADDVTSSTFDLSALSTAVLYVPGVASSGSQAANSGVAFAFALEMRHT